MRKRCTVPWNRSDRYLKCQQSANISVLDGNFEISDDKFLHVWRIAWISSICLKFRGDAQYQVDCYLNGFARISLCIPQDSKLATTCLCKPFLWMGIFRNTNSETFRKDPSKYWQAIKPYMTDKINATDQSISLFHENRVVNKPAEVCNIFN